MRNYFFGSGLISAVTGGITLLRGSKNEPFTWRSALAWISWGISVALVIGAIVDMRRDKRNKVVDMSQKKRRKLSA